MKLGSFHKALTFPNNYQPWRESPNKDINLIPNLKLSATRTTKHGTTRHGMGTTNHNMTEQAWSG
jgi:hypothetical protein